MSIAEMKFTRNNTPVPSQAPHLAPGFTEDSISEEQVQRVLMRVYLRLARSEVMAKGGYDGPQNRRPTRSGGAS